MNYSRGASARGGVGTHTLTTFAGQHVASDSPAHIDGAHTAGQGADLIGTSGDDFILGTDSRELIKGLNGSDELIGFGGADTIDGGNGDDIIDGGKGDDQLLGRNGHDIILGEQGNDNIVGGAGVDWGYFHNALFSGGDGDNGITADFTTGIVTDRDGFVDHMVSVEDVIGTLNADTITGDDNNNGLYGYAGGDTLNGGGGDDYMSVDQGLNAVANGGDGEDTLAIIAFAGGMKVNLSTEGLQQVTGDVSVTISGVENVSGYYYNDTLIGTDGDNKLYGDFGDDLLRGGYGNDHLYGDGFDHGDGDIVTDAYSVGNDTLVGGAGNDVLNGGGGADNLQGGFDSDTFVYEFLDDSGNQASAPDTLDLITDLDSSDWIDLSGIEANYGVTLVQVAHLSGAGDTGEFTLQYNAEADTTYLKVDADGDGKQDMVVAISGDHSDFTNFVL